jgi:hypothetical protein
VIIAIWFRTHRTVIVPVALHRCGIVFQSEGRTKLRRFGNKVLKRIFRPRKEKWHENKKHKKIICSMVYIFN